MYDDPGTLNDILNHHRSVFECIRNREPEKAFEAMREHIIYVKEYFHSR